MVREMGEEDSWEQELVQGCHDLGIQLERGQARSFRLYLRELLIWNPQAGLVSTADQFRLVSRHILDSLVLLRVLHPLPGASVLDVGSGGGFPGLPLRICCPQIGLTLLEPREKSFFFLRHICQTLKIKDVSIRRQRAQQAARQADMRGQFDLVLARALANLERLAPLCFPFVREGGLMVAYKGPKAEREAVLAQKQIRLAKGQLQGIVKTAVPGVSGHRYVVLLTKASALQKDR